MMFFQNVIMVIVITAGMNSGGSGIVNGGCGITNEGLAGG